MRLPPQSLGFARGDTVRSWWQKIRKSLAVIAAIALFAGVLVLLILAGYRLTWTGFFNKTLWDWLNLLGVFAIPAVVGIGAAWYTVQQGKVSDRENKDNQREATLQAYIDKISELLLKEHLDELKPEFERVREIARARTLTVLPQLDAERKLSVLRFLGGSHLLQIVPLNVSDLSGIRMHNINERNINIRDANLMYASLNNSTLEHIDLKYSNWSYADISNSSITHCILDHVNLSHTKIAVTN